MIINHLNLLHQLLILNIKNIYLINYFLNFHLFQSSYLNFKLHFITNNLTTICFFHFIKLIYISYITNNYFYI